MGKKAKRPSPRMRRASETNDAVERILNETNLIGAEMRHIPMAVDNAARLRRGQHMRWPSSMAKFLGEEKYSAVVDHVTRYAMVDLWRKQSRLAYDVHLEMANRLYRSDMTCKFPATLFTRLRHINPMLPLPRPWPFKDGDGKEGLIRAYFLLGSTGDGFCMTTDERMDVLLLVPWIEFPPEEDDGSGRPDVMTPMIALPVTDKPFTLTDIIKSANKWHGSKGDPSDKLLMRQLVPGALTLLTYLCCKNADIEEPPPLPTKGKRRQAPPREIFWSRVGWHIGPKLHDTQRRSAGRVRDGVSTPSGVEYGPQHRVGHTKVVWSGPGRTKDDVIWVDPYWTKLDMLDEGQEPVTQIVPVDPQHGDPSSHKDIRRANLGTAKANEITKRERQRAREEGWDF